MDNKITKKRLSDFLSYEWILIIVLSIVAVLVVDLIYTMTSVRLTVGQKFKFYYDYDVYAGSNMEMVEQLKEDDAFSFDVQKIFAESLLEDNDLLTTRLSIYEGDMIFTIDKEPEEDSTTRRNLAKLRVDATPVYAYNDLYADVKTYLGTLLKDGLETDKELQFNYENLDEHKIEQGFNARLGEDNRFRKAEQKSEGIRLEKERIKKLCKEASDFKKIIELPDEYFFCYTKYEQKLATAKAENDAYGVGLYEEVYNKELTKVDKLGVSRKNARYGLRMDKLKLQTNGTKKDITEFLSLSYSEPASAENIVALVFDLREHQPELQFETISVINSLVRTCSTILD